MAGEGQGQRDTQEEGHLSATRGPCCHSRAATLHKAHSELETAVNCCPGAQACPNLRQRGSGTPAGPPAAREPQELSTSEAAPGHLPRGPPRPHLPSSATYWLLRTGPCDLPRADLVSQCVPS